MVTRDIGGKFVGERRRAEIRQILRQRRINVDSTSSAKQYRENIPATSNAPNQGINRNHTHRSGLPCACGSIPNPGDTDQRALAASRQSPPSLRQAQRHQHIRKGTPQRPTNRSAEGIMLTSTGLGQQAHFWTRTGPPLITQCVRFRDGPTKPFLVAYSTTPIAIADI